MLSLPLKSLPQQIVPIYSRKEVDIIPKHLDVRLENDEDINTNLRKEVSIGDVKEGPQFEDPKALLENVFNK
jgi:hypothetical protein